MSEVLVLGAGIVGVASALALQAKGFDVVLVDKSEPGSEASYGNAGIIQAEAAEPYALPRDVPTLLSYALELGNDLVWQTTAVAKMRKGLLSYFNYSSPRTHATISKAYSRLIARSTKDHEPLIIAAKAESLISKNGLFILYRDAKKLDEAILQANQIKARYGTQFRDLTGNQYRLEEPALQKTPAGAIHWLSSWSCSDPGALTKAYAELFKLCGGEFVPGNAQSLTQTSRGWAVTETSEAKLEAKHAVICLGHSSPKVLRKFDYDIPMIYKRGYHGHFQCQLAPKVPFLDMQNGIVASAMSKGLRLSSGAALVNIDSPSHPEQLRRGSEAIGDLLDIGPPVNEPQWFGTRPCLPDMLPLVGMAPRHQNLWFNFGHGHQGFTLGPTSAELLALQMIGEPSELCAPLLPAARKWIKG